jgi:Lysophospholipase
VTATAAVPVIASWPEPEGIAPRGTVVVVPGRGEHPRTYERFGRRIAADGYRVWAVSDPLVDESRTINQIHRFLAAAADDEIGPRPRVLVGSDSGALFVAGLAARGVPGIAGIVLAGLPIAGEEPVERDWADEVEARTACPTHQRVLTTDDAFRRAALAERLPATWFAQARAAEIAVPVLGLHGEADPVSPLDSVRPWYADVPSAELVGIASGRHDALNDQTHRTAAATIVLFLERLRIGADAPAIAREVAL